MDDDIFNTITGGDSVQTQPVVNNPVKQNVQDNDPFGLLNLNVGTTQQSVNNQFNPVSNVGGFDMNFFGFGSTPQTQQGQSQNNNSFGGNSLLGNDFLGLGGPTQTQQNPVQNTGFGINTQSNQMSGFNWNQQPPVAQNNQNQVAPLLAYENSQIQIWMKCIKQTNDTTKITATYTNKTQSAIENLSIAAAVMKHLKLTLNPLNTTTLPPMSKDVVNQVIFFIIFYRL